VKRVILPVALVGALLAVGCKSNKSTTAPTTALPSELNPPAVQQVIPAAPAPTPEPVVVTPARDPAPTPAPVKAADKPAKVSKPVASTDKPAPTHVKAATPAKTAASAKVYVVQKGDTLSDIAKKHSTTIKKIVDLNKGLNPDRIIVGQKIKMP
jgi:LysM repeat protein